MATATMNGKLPRKQLSDQLDRMDTLIDGLADALPEAVADACRDGARQAVKDAVLEILGSPELRALITEVASARATPASEPIVAKPSIWTRLRAKLAELRTRVAAPIQSAKEAVAMRIRTATTLASIAAGVLTTVLPSKTTLLAGAIIGLTVGVIGYASSHLIAAMIGGVGASCVALIAKVGRWFSRDTRSLA